MQFGSALGEVRGQRPGAGRPRTLKSPGEGPMVIAVAAGLGVGAPEVSAALLGQCQPEPELLAKSLMPAQQMAFPACATIAVWNS